MREQKTLGKEPAPPKPFRPSKVKKLADFVKIVESHGWKVSSRGWPKFLCWNPNGDISLAYALGPGRRLSKVQRFIAYQFSQRGIPVYTWSEDDGFRVFDPLAYRLHYAQVVNLPDRAKRKLRDNATLTVAGTPFAGTSSKP